MELWKKFTSGGYGLSRADASVITLLQQERKGDRFIEGDACQEAVVEPAEHPVEQVPQGSHVPAPPAGGLQ